MPDELSAAATEHQELNITLEQLLAQEDHHKARRLLLMGGDKPSNSPRILPACMTILCRFPYSMPITRQPSIPFIWIAPCHTIRTPTPYPTNSTPRPAKIGKHVPPIERLIFPSPTNTNTKLHAHLTPTHSTTLPLAAPNVVPHHASAEQPSSENGAAKKTSSAYLSATPRRKAKF